jgi:hypothetical protein
MSSRLFLLLLLLIPFSLSAKTYFFKGTTDHLFENPANWSPAHPGSNLLEGDKWVIESQMYVSVPDLLISGMLEIKTGAKVVATEFSRSISLHLLGSIDNGGELILKDFYQAGSVFNRQGCRMHIRNHLAQPTAFTQNFGTMTSLDSFENQGRFDNYGLCNAEGDFGNMAVFNQIRDSKLVVAGELFFSPGCILNQSRESEIFVGTVRKVAIHEKLAAFFQ